MIRNFVRIAIRHLMAHRSFSLINIAGLSTGLASCFLLLLFIEAEFKVDKHHQDLDQLYRLNTIFINVTRETSESATSGPPIGFALLDEIPEIETVTRVFRPLSAEEFLVTYQDRNMYETNARIADSTFFSIFHFPFLEGNPQTALNQPNTIVISATMATKLFDDEPASGKIITITDDFGKLDYKVTGVFDDQTYRTHLNPNYITSMYTEGWGEMVNSFESWATQNFIYTYLKISPDADPGLVEQKIKQIVDQRAALDFEKAGYSKNHRLFPLKDIYLHSKAVNNWEFQGSATLNYVLTGIAFLILILACVNYINLTTAKSMQRAREIGLRKALGAYRPQIIRQFLTESFVLSFISVLIGMMLTVLFLPYFNQFFGLNLQIDLMKNPVQVLIILSITLLTGLLSGAYPAFLLSGFAPIKALKISGQLSGGGNGLRRSLVVTQYVIAISLLISVAFIYRQLKYSLQFNAGLEAASKLVVPLRTDLAQETFHNLSGTLLQNPHINQVSGADYVPGKTILSDFKMYRSGANMEEGDIVRFNRVEKGYLNLFNLTLMAGRGFQPEENVYNIIINEKTAEKFNWTADQAVGQPLFTHWNDSIYQFKIIGVTANYNHSSTYEEQHAIALASRQNMNFNNAILEFETSALHEVLNFLEKTWKQANLDTPFDFYFLEDALAAQYENEQRSMTIITAFAILAILISSLGLYGLSTYTIQKRSKEISVRKVLGASISHLLVMLTGQYIKLIALAFFIAVPISFYLVQKWLDKFVYHIEPDALTFLISGFLIAGFTLMVIGYHTLQSTRQNPVKALRSE